MNTHSKRRAKGSITENSRILAGAPGISRTDEPIALAKKSSDAAKSKAALPEKTRKMARRSAQASRAATQTERLVCRYCGSADLVPSFIKRRDARCRACFKQRYGSATRLKKTARIPQAQAVK